MRAPVLQLARNATWLLLGDGLVKLGLLLVTVLVARGLGPAAMGVFTVALGAATVAVPLSALGQVELLIRETAAAPDRARGLLAAARRGQWRLLAWLLPLAVVLILATARGPLRLTLLAFLPYVPLRVEGLTRGAVFKGLDRMDVEVKARGLELGTILLLVAAAAFLGWPVWTVGAAYSVGGAVGLQWLLSATRRLPGSAALAPSHARSALLRGLPFFGLAVLFQLLLRADSVLMAGLGVPQEEIGRYGAATAVTWGLLALAQVVALATFPALSRRAAGGGRSLGPTLFAATAGMALGSLVAAGLLLLRDPLVRIAFGDRFGATTELLATLAWALPAASASMVLGVVVAAWHAQTRSLAWLAVTVAVNVALVVTWVPQLGAAGAARAAVVAHCLGAVGNLVLAGTAGRLQPSPTGSPEAPGDG